MKNLYRDIQAEWCDDVCDALCDLGKISREDVQALIRAQKSRGYDVLSVAWRDDLTAEAAARRILCLYLSG
jgi:hypothetical protein